MPNYFAKEIKAKALPRPNKRLETALHPSRLRDRPNVRNARLPNRVKVVVNSQPVHYLNYNGLPHEIFMEKKPTKHAWRGTYKEWRILQSKWRRLPKHLKLSARDVKIPFRKYRGYFSIESLWIHVYHMYRRLLGITDPLEFPLRRDLIDMRSYFLSTRKVFRTVQVIRECSRILDHVLHDPGAREITS